MVAEDFSTRRLFIWILFGPNRFNVIEVQNSQEILAKLKKDPDIMMRITDYNMRLVNGYELVPMFKCNALFQNSAITGRFVKGINILWQNL